MIPKVSVIIVSYNTQELTLKCLNSVYESQGLKDQFEVIVVDNASTDDSVKKIKAKFPRVKLISNNKNLGFGKANNQGVAEASSEYILLLNTDAFLGVGSLSAMLKVLENDKTTLSVGPQLRYLDGSLQLSCGYFPTILRVTAWMWWFDKLPILKSIFQNAYHVVSPSWHTKDQHPDWMMGACLLFRRSEFLRVGGFDEEMFMYGEEVELYYRLSKIFKTKRNLFKSSIKVVHVGSASTKSAGFSRLNYELSGIKYFYKKHFPQLLGLTQVILYSGVLLRRLIFGLIPSKKGLSAEYKSYLF